MLYVFSFSKFYFRLPEIYLSNNFPLLIAFDERRSEKKGPKEGENMLLIEFIAYHEE